MPKRKDVNNSLRITQFLPVPFTPEPKRKMRYLSEDTSKKEVGVAVAEAEILARMIENKHSTPQITNAIRALMVGACLHAAKGLDTHHIDPQMVRDVYPYGRVIESKFTRQLFESLMIEVKTTAPRLYESVLGAKPKKKRR